LNSTGGKLSKRHSHASVDALRDANYEAAAVVSFVSQLGYTFRYTPPDECCMSPLSLSHSLARSLSLSLSRSLSLALSLG
jgi:glutamyl/glutaminyl-tRNA synthetase